MMMMKVITATATMGHIQLRQPLLRPDQE